MKIKTEASAQPPRPVFVRAYQRVRDGKREFVRRHTRRPQAQMVLPFEQVNAQRAADDVQE